MLHRATVSAISPTVLVKMKGDDAAIPAKVPTSPSISLSVGADVLVELSDGELIVIARLT